MEFNNIDFHNSRRQHRRFHRRHHRMSNKKSGIEDFIENHGQHFVVGAIGGLGAQALGVTNNPVNFGIFIGGMDFIRKHIIEGQSL